MENQPNKITSAVFSKFSVAIMPSTFLSFPDCPLKFYLSPKCLMPQAFSLRHLKWAFALVRVKGFEPPTYWFVASHSIQLSYTRILKEDFS